MMVSAVTVANGSGDRKLAGYTLTGLKRWSSQQKHLPSPASIKAIHVYDFDNTLFKSPLPNPKLWHSSSVGRLQTTETFIAGGWWHDARILRATGQGFEKEEKTGWEGWWNETIVELTRLSAQQKDTISVLLTGRSERGFADLLKKMISAKSLTFDLVCLKPEVGPHGQRFGSTMAFKQAFLNDLVYTFNDAEEIRVYEDRPKQVKGFRDFFQKLHENSFPAVSRKPFTADVILVSDDGPYLDPLVETTQVQQMVNDHNAQIPPMSRALELRKTVYFTGYMISEADTAKLLSLVKIPPNLAESDIKFLANSILIAPRPADPALLNSVGGIGRKQAWQVTGFSFYQSSIWAVRVNQVPSTSTIMTHNNNPLVVLAVYKNTRPDLANNIHTWQPIPADKQHIFDTEVGEKVQLRIETESQTSEVDPNLRAAKRRRTPNSSAPSAPNGRFISAQNGGVAIPTQPRQKTANGIAPPTGPANTQNTSRTLQYSGPPSNNPPQGPRAQRARPNRPGYRSLDDDAVAASGQNYYTMGQNNPPYEEYSPHIPQYDAAFPALGQFAPNGNPTLNYGK